MRLGTRGSALAVTQSESVADALRRLGHDVEVVRIKTGGDVERGSLTALGSLGVFAAELRTRLLAGEVDIAVHSLKDLPVAPVPGLVIAAVPRRADHRDVLCARDGLTLEQLPPGARVGTGSPRRISQLRALRPDLAYVDVRGNLGTRLARVSAGDLDAIVLAAAGLERLGLADRITDHLPLLPAPGQGALAVECRADDVATTQILAALEHPETRLAVEEERAALAGLGGGCAAPIAALAAGGRLEAAVFAVDGRRQERVAVDLAPGAGARAVAELLAVGVAEVTELAASRPSRLGDLHDDSSLWGSVAVLAGVRVLLPRAEGRLADALRAAGAEVVAVPLQRRVVCEAMPDLDADWVAVTSAATVEEFEARGWRIPPGARIAAVGPSTAEALRRAGYTVDLPPSPGEPATAAALAQRWPQGPGRVVIPGSALSSPTLADGLRAKGYAVETVPVYTVEPVEAAPESLAAEWAAGHFDVVAVTAGSIGRAVGRLLGWRDDVRVVAFGAPSASALAGQGVEVAQVAETQDGDGLVAAIAAAVRGEQG
ncbi:MAG TPA: hydroxymethylbilane synthase [Arachnia sp.]|nr:hydroxymethylbilane synthase [Arachnia sp.]HMT86677.1 hydroxymethylbilane synthase [Arachnia sp.]